MPPSAKFTRISVRVVGAPIVARHARCAGSYEMEKCEALERQRDQETLQEKQVRQKKLDDERQRNMAEVNASH